MLSLALLGMFGVTACCCGNSGSLGVFGVTFLSGHSAEQPRGGRRPEEALEA